MSGPDDEVFLLFLTFLDQAGYLMFNEASQSDLVILNPMWLVDKLCCIVRSPSLHKRPEDKLLKTEKCI